MELSNIIREIDKEIERLGQARGILSSMGDTPQQERTARKPGRKRRHMSEEGRRRIAAAQRKRWAKMKRGRTGMLAAA